MDIRKRVDELKNMLDSIQMDKIAECVEACTAAFRNGRKLLICGNGGSAADAQHFAAELVGRFIIDRHALPAIALTTDTSVITAVGNDYSFDSIFSRQVEALGNEGDVLVAISTSGNSLNTLNAVDAAKNVGMTTISLTGNDGGSLATRTDISVVVPSKATCHVQECHLFIEHTICEEIERLLYGKD